MTTAMVLGAGLGTRMRPLTLERPKPLVELDGKTLVDHMIDRLEEAGVERVVVNVHHHAEQMEAHLARRSGPEIHISDERSELLDTGGGVAKALRLLGPGPFLVCNADTVWFGDQGRNIPRLIERWDGRRMDSLLMLAPAATSIGYAGKGDFEMGPSGQLTRRAEREVAPFVFAGVSIAEASLFSGCPSGPFSLNRLWSRAIERERLFGMRLDGIWMHVGDPAALEESQKWLRTGELYY